jgi:uncharacterized membrane protein YciS (DUF1049 family)
MALSTLLPVLVLILFGLFLGRTVFRHFFSRPKVSPVAQRVTRQMLRRHSRIMANARMSGTRFVHSGAASGRKLRRAYTRILAQSIFYRLRQEQTQQA